MSSTPSRPPALHLPRPLLLFFSPPPSPLIPQHLFSRQRSHHHPPLPTLTPRRGPRPPPTQDSQPPLSRAGSRAASARAAVLPSPPPPTSQPHIISSNHLPPPPTPCQCVCVCVKVCVCKSVWTTRCGDARGLRPGQFPAPRSPPTCPNPRLAKWRNTTSLTPSTPGARSSSPADDLSHGHTAIHALHQPPIDSCIAIDNPNQIRSRLGAQSFKFASLNTAMRAGPLVRWGVS